MENMTLEILKQAILLEMRGKIFYTNASESSNEPAVKEIFRMMANEEEQHIHFLKQQFKNFRQSGKFDFSGKGLYTITPIADQVLDPSFSTKLSAVGFEATAISMAIDMENRAIAAYSERSLNASDPEEKKFYEWLADWERGHHKILFELDQELREKIWNDNSFWPF